MLFGVPMHALTNGVFPLTDLVGGEASTLPEQLAEAPDWERRFAIIDDVITHRLADAEPVSEAVAWAWRAVNSGGSQMRVGALADELGWSRKHLIAQFRDGVGLAPKTLSRVVRFNRVVRRLRPGHAGSLAQLAFESGYYDQAHFIRDFRQFAGVTPGEYLRQSLPNGAGVAVA
jgi:AraC-like DNA-binding protein